MLTADDDVLKATVATLKICENTLFDRNRHLRVSKTDNCIDNRNELSQLSNPAVSVTGESSESLFLNSRSLDHGKNIPDISTTNYSKFQNAIQALEVINLMYSFYHEKKPQQKGDDLKYINEYLACIMSPAVKMKLEKMQSVLDHITVISTHGAKLKQVLRSNVLNEFWKINVDYHKSVVRFFTLTQEITKDIQGFITSIEKSKEHNLDRSKNLLALETKLLTELHENLDILTEFQNYIQSSVI